MSDFDRQGWQIFAPEPVVEDWVQHALPAVRSALEDPALDHWYECERTWFVGLDALPNDAEGRVLDGPPLTGAVVDFVTRACGGWPRLHAAQISGVFEGYPQPRDGESDAAFRYRRNRDAAHVDGVLGEGTPKRRFVREPHAFILGLPLTPASPQAAPLVVWEGSHKIMQAAFSEVFADVPADAMGLCDVTDAYVAARRRVFETCNRVAVCVPPGGAMVLHRMALHGVAPFAPAGRTAPEGRLIAYFRPPMPGGVAAWLAAP
ncbi:MAG: hypothetical protein AB8B58_09510 [Roseobacter sp.]